MYGKMKKKDGGSMSEGMMGDYTSVSEELSAKEQSKKKDTPKPKRKTKAMAKGGKVSSGYKCSHNRLY